MKNTAILLIGYQNDYFAEEGILRKVVEESSKITGILNNTINLLRNLKDIHIISTPIIFSKNYEELQEPVGILKTIKEVGAFKVGESGSKTIKELDEFKNRITEIPGKQGLNAFVNTELDSFLAQNDISNIVFAGTVCSICIDSTGRSAFEKGYNISMLSDCISGRTVFEQKFYCENIFPLYSNVITSKDLIKQFSLKPQS